MKEITLEARLENIPKVTAFVDTELEALDCPLKAQMQIDVAIDEIFSNIARYAYTGKTGDATVRFEFEADPKTCILTFLDQGVPYNPLEKKDPDVTKSAEEREIGGLGIFLVKKTMDNMTYERDGNTNMLSLYKKIG